MNSSAHGFAVLCEIDQWKTSPGLLLTFDIILWRHLTDLEAPTHELIITCTVLRILSVWSYSFTRESRRVILALKGYSFVQNDLLLSVLRIGKTWNERMYFMVSWFYSECHLGLIQISSGVQGSFKPLATVYYFSLRHNQVKIGLNSKKKSNIHSYLRYILPLGKTSF